MSRLVTFLGLPLLLLGPVTAALAQTFTVFDAPNGVGTHGLSINAGGDVTGSFFDTLTHTLRGYVRDRNGNFTVFDAPNASASVSGTASLSINNRGDVTGYFLDASQRKQRGFVRDQNGNFTVFDAPNALATTSISINAGGTVLGTFTDASGAQHCFVRDPNGNFSVFDVPNAIITRCNSINDRGAVTGLLWYGDPSRNPSHGFVRSAH